MQKTVSIAVALLAAVLAAPASAHQAHPPGGAAPAPAPQARPVRLADTPLRDQDGRRLRLASDVVGDKLVVASFIFTNCTDVCPLVSHTFAQVQEQLGGLMEQRVRLLSLTVDPARDTPERLKAYAASYQPRPGWLWLTGEPPAVAAALQGFGVHVTRTGTHPNVIVIGEARSGRWLRVYDTESPQKVVAKVRELLGGQN
jgi:protein SCO1/2